ncbi:hypothetical protein ACIQOF_35750 [Streptomyces sp. NPDC091265]|uniref:hypothetical protein n=1 Tax=unclassified Streptomyces TaxID=2593676 RepID=UPI003450A9FA
MQAVLETSAADGLSLWPVDEYESHGYLGLDRKLTPAQVGTAVMRIADYNYAGPEEERAPCPADPLGTFLQGLRTLVAGAQQDLQDFLSVAGTWAEQHLPAHAAEVTAALARALDLASAR